ncbi:DUF7844 domain-containing protein [Pseudomonas sp. N040]|uniref:DUF7844 domain-containing protein n=1 Tax=Pseudomonas sp. N040 TaxID=2785325 RepID=UPI0018A2CB98|nr:DUF4105 domain-containing protein [Pseudomonas sp. N040]MBF7728977.1 DUF4105 domain-containing protein [Pseudomonas sp. N040]MBW7012617.1 DUF4105 domain-containing protein [Pseudomonas sp. N040]
MLRLWLAFACLLGSASVFGNLRLELDTSGLTDAEQQASQALLEQAMAALPPSFVERLDQQVSVGWQSGLPAQAYGQADPRHSRLALNAELLPALVDGSASQPSRRSHGSQQRELLATVLHELTHLYDRARLQAPAAQLKAQRCRQQLASRGPIGLAEHCRSLGARRFSLSDDPRLLDLAGWQERAGQRGARDPRNDQTDRSPDTYELSNPREFVAVNLEYFLLDPSYACRRPGLQRYFREHFGWAPASQAACRPGLAYMNASHDFTSQPLGSIDPQQVYAVDYLFADANQQWMSRWGHGMLRLVICAPGRPRGPQCRLDLDRHLVLSYRAFVGDVQLSSWDGLSGNYPSRLFVLPLEQVIEEYTKVELRSLNSIPLRLSRAQIGQLLEQAAQLHWSYDGGYYFFSNNCAVETLKLLRTGTRHPQLQSLDSILPNGLQELLAARGVADLGVLDDRKQALRLGYRFDSFRERYQAMFMVLHERLPIPQSSVEEWLELSASERRQWFAAADLRSNAALLLLEQAALRRQMLLAQDELKRTYLDQAGAVDNPAWSKASQTLKAMLDESGFLSRPAQLLDSGYGLPQDSEWQALQAGSSSRQRQLQLLSGQLETQIRQLLEPARLAELEGGKANLQQLDQRLREQHKASGGLIL